MTSKIALPVRTSSPISFNLWDDDRQPVLYITAPHEKAHALTLEIENTTAHTLRFEPSGTTASAADHHFALRFQRGTLSESTLRKLRDPSLSPGIFDGEGWALAPLPNAAGQVDETTLYFLCLEREPEKLRLEPGERRELFRLQGFTAAPGTGARRTNVELTPQRTVYAGDPSSKVTGICTQGLNILNHAGAKHAPLGVTFTPSTLRPADQFGTPILRIQNLGTTTLGLAGNSPTRFEISFECGDTASCLSASDNRPELSDPVLRGGSQKVIGSSTRNHASDGSWNVVLTAGHQLSPGDAIDIAFGTFKVGKPGTATVVINYYELTGFREGSLLCTVEKSAVSQRLSGAVDVFGQLVVADPHLLRTTGREHLWSHRGDGSEFSLTQIQPDKIRLMRVGVGEAKTGFEIKYGAGGNNALSISQALSVRAPTWDKDVEATLLNCEASVKGRPEFPSVIELQGKVDIGNATCPTTLGVTGQLVVEGGDVVVTGGALRVPRPDGDSDCFKVTADKGTEVDGSLQVRGSFVVSTLKRKLLEVTQDGTAIRGAIKSLFYSPDMTETWRTVWERSTLKYDFERSRPAVMQGLLPQAAKEQEKPAHYLFRRGLDEHGTPEVIDLGTGAVKTFIVNHPQDDTRYLVHATLEGPENAVYYRGTARVQAGRARVELPPYFEALTRREGRTIQLTNVDGFDRLAVQTQEGELVKDGAFLVASAELTSNQAFAWEVKAVRRDVSELTVEPLRSELEVQGFGPYTYGVPAKRVG